MSKGDAGQMSEVEKEQRQAAAPMDADAAASVGGDAEPSAAPIAENALPSELEATRAALQAARIEAESARTVADDYLSRLSRMQADWDNYRKRAQRESEEMLRYANLSLVRDLLPVLDNLERALAAAGGESAALEGLRDGVALTARQFHEVLARVGVEPVPGVGSPFDPGIHEAVMQVEGDQPGEIVVEEFQKGYRMGDRLVRPSMVKVAKK